MAQELRSRIQTFAVAETTFSLPLGLPLGIELQKEKS